MTEKTFSVYTLSDPRTNQVRYVGISCNVEQRYLSHLHDKQNASKGEWISELKQQQLAPLLSVIETGLELKMAQTRELSWIRHYLESGVNLVNISGVTKPYTGGLSALRKRQTGQTTTTTVSIRKPMLTIKETAQRMGTTPDVVKRMLEHSEMPGYRIFPWRVDQDELEEFILTVWNRYKPAQEK